ncbi:hypothetical protein SAMN02745136_04920 [Anaerocolumna jejuensis DSM 15929]|uniref:Uncharacterized protein n=1 Tax=Anaerocolumna jejuensis DSM 15929 TaxID=1121322 RepID=A0A1M7APJ7_9FIRM|nr:hypothetical protein [Anaerocolumna jejuensis]SHL44641.1 hypothetical protein SAMN02745136_04920 [Anaerocolumna jejuensis DSM 15929]
MPYEVEYVIPFEILFEGSFRDNWEAKEAVFTNEVTGLFQLLEIAVNANELAEEYCNLDRGQGDVHVFFDAGKDKFLLIDLYLGHTDQHNMIVLAGHVPCYMEEQMKAAMLAIYNDEDAVPKSDFSEYFNNKLLADIDKSNYPRECELYYQKIFYHD